MLTDVDRLQMLVDSDWATDKVDRKDRRLCRRQKLRDTSSEAVHAKDSSSVLWQMSWVLS